ncbi:MAG: pantetheine-phosphate adenylyltransferase, partial [Candidatus Peribacteraceae bacterium]|nr:pantetheine-phosphate adenylyltransferase [Candidatus Peribacteraceae bacterium]
AGSFDPITYGHIDIINKALVTFDNVIVLIAINPKKTYMFGTEMRRFMVQQSFPDNSNVRVLCWSGLIVDFVNKSPYFDRDKDISILVRGLRAVSDFEMELQMAQINRKIGGVETNFIPTEAKNSFVSSTAVREIAKLNGEVSSMVPPHVEEAIHELIKKGE